jgi:hypothetical protein
MRLYTQRNYFRTALIPTMYIIVTALLPNFRRGIAAVESIRSPATLEPEPEPALSLTPSDSGLATPEPEPEPKPEPEPEPEPDEEVNATPLPPVPSMVVHAGFRSYRAGACFHGLLIL